MTPVNREMSIPRILVVDDDPGSRLLARAALEKSGFSVQEAENGRIALELFEKEQHEMILLDVVMPEMDGYSMCRALRRRPDGWNTPVLMLTGLEDLESVQEAFDAGATDFISKPINWLLLHYRIHYILRASRVFRALQVSQARLRKAQQIAKLGHWELDLATGHFECCEEARRLLGIPPEAPSSYDQLFAGIPSDDRDRVRNIIDNAQRNQTSFSLDFRLPGRNGKERFISSQGEVLPGNTGSNRIMTGIVQDVTRLKKAEEKIRRLALYDNLTGLANRLLFKEHLEKAISLARRRNLPLAVMFLDLDHFKKINDTLGHHMGDLLLQQVAERLTSSLRETDSIARTGSSEQDVDCISRLGGDEFSLLLSGISSPETAAKLAERVLANIARPMLLEGHETFITTSLGISIYPTDGDTAEKLLRNADTAMYHAKTEGRNNHQFFRQSMNTATRLRLAMENDLRKALENDEFFLCYQPQFNIDQSIIVGAEALIRWQHPEKGLLMPGDFLQIAIESGLISRINRWVLRKACLQLRAWDNSRLRHMRIAVNLSDRQFGHQDFYEMTRSILEETGVDPNRLEIELTESIIMQREEETVASLHQLKSLGVRLAIDDFGTGYSSLSYLKKFPVDTLKVDRSFIKDITRNPTDVAIAKAIITLARHLNLKVVTEGIETAGQLNLLRELGCHYAQGYFLGRPQVAEEFVRLVTAGEGKRPAPLAGC